MFVAARHEVDLLVYSALIGRKWSSDPNKQKVKVKSLSRVRLFVTPWTVAYQAPLSMGFSRQEYWNRLLFPSPGDLPNPGIEPGSLALQWILYNCATWEAPVVGLTDHKNNANTCRWLEKEMATHSSTLAWKIPWMEDPGRLQSIGLQRVGHDWATPHIYVI